MLFVSLFFYLWGGIAFFPVMVFSIMVNYTGGRLMDWLRKSQNLLWCKIVFTITLVLNLGNLVYWKYTGFLVDIVRNITGWKIHIPEIILPIGISFFTFQGMSYVIDLHREYDTLQWGWQKSNTGKFCCYYCG